MKKRALRKDFYMEIKKSLNRFISIFLIVALGVAFYSGIQSAAPDMRYSGDAYFDEHKLMDLKVVSTLGLTEDDIEAISQVDGVELTEGAYMTDVLCGEDTDQYVLRVESISPTLNQLTAEEGRVPEKAGEIFVDLEFLDNAGLKIGDTIEFYLDDEDDYQLKKHTFTIVGAGSSPLYISFNRGNTTLGTGELSGAAYVLAEDFDYEVYTQAYIRVKGADNLTAYTDAYDTLIAKVQDRVEAIADERCEIRYREVLSDANEELADAREELSDGESEAESELADAWDEIYDGDRKLREAKLEVLSGERELTDGEAQIAEAESELADGEAEIAENEQTLADGQAQLADGWSQYRSGKKEYESSKAEFDKTYESTMSQLEEGQTQIDSAKAQLETGRTEYEAGLAQYQEQLAKYEAAKAQLASWPAQKTQLEQTKVSLQTQLESLTAGVSAATTQRDAAQSQVDTAQTAVNAAQSAADAAKGAVNTAQQEVDNRKQELAEIQKKEELSEADKQRLQALPGEISSAENALQEKQTALSEANETLANAQAELTNAQTNLTTAQAALDGYTARKTQIESSIAQIETTISTTDASAAALEGAKTQLDDAKTTLDASLAQIEAGEAEVAANQKKIDDGKTQLEEGKAKLEAAAATLAASEKKLKSSQAQLDSGAAQLAEAKSQLEEGRQELADAKQELENGRKELEDGKAEIKENEPDLKKAKISYKIGEKEAEDEIADAQQKIDDAQQEIDDLEVPEWTVSDRSDLPENIGYGENADRMRSIGEVFPVMFFLVAALISLTTMTRMVEEERTQIGTLKALGYSKASIAMKYLCYALLATLGGSLAGIAFGEKFLPFVIVTAYRIMYRHMTTLEIPYNMKYAVIATAAALASTMLATLAACYRELATTPAVLMRPPAPKEGKRVLLERIPFIWRRLSFTWKSTVRNLFRYKKRFFMTVFGIGGCMALMLVGYGLRDSISDIGHLQFQELQLFDAMVILDTDEEEDRQQELIDAVSASASVENATKTLMQKETVRRGKKSWNVYLIVPQDLEEAADFLVFRDRETKESYELTDEGAIITEKIASLMGVKAGDTITLETENDGNLQVPIAAVTENYLTHYIYMTPTLYEKCAGKTPEYNEVMFRATEETDNAALNALGQEFLNYDAALSISYSASTMSQIDSMLSTLDSVIIVLIISAGLLAFVVLYNLSNININERKRELATLKVLGFFDGEVDAYVYRENILITVIGILAGMGMGRILHYFVITTVEVDATMFGRNINWPSFAISAAYTAVFSVLVNFAMHYKLKKIDMVESLKSIE